MKLVRLFQVLALAVLTLQLKVGAAVAQVFPVSAASQTTLTNISADIVAWGVAILAVVLTFTAYKWIRRIANH